jgi:transcriptional regulator with XRE-family HTH domain
MIGERVKQERERRGWSQEELAQRAALGQSYISKLELNRSSNPTKDALERLARAFSITVDELLHGGDQQQAAPAVERVPTLLQELGLLLPYLTPAEQDAVIDHARALRDRRVHGR